VLHRFIRDPKTVQRLRSGKMGRYIDGFAVGLVASA